jgi:hypothetical protein
MNPLLSSSSVKLQLVQKFKVQAFNNSEEFKPFQSFKPFKSSNVYALKNEAGIGVAPGYLNNSRYEAE